MNNFEKYIGNNTKGRVSELSLLSVGDEYYFQERFKRATANPLYRKLRYYSIKYPEIEFATKVIKNGTIVKRIK